MGSRKALSAKNNTGILLAVIFVLFGAVILARAEGEQADQKCEPFVKECECGMILETVNGKQQCVKKGGPEVNTHNCPLFCVDMTSGFPTKGECVAAGKCKGRLCNGKPCEQPKQTPEKQQGGEGKPPEGGQPPKLPEMPKPEPDKDPPPSTQKKPTDRKTDGTIGDAFGQQGGEGKGDSTQTSRDSTEEELLRLAGEDKTSLPADSTQPSRSAQDQSNVFQLTDPLRSFNGEPMDQHSPGNPPDANKWGAYFQSEVDRVQAQQDQSSAVTKDQGRVGSADGATGFTAPNNGAATQPQGNVVSRAWNSVLSFFGWRR